MFEFLKARANANANVELHRSHRSLCIQLCADEEVAYAYIGPDGIAVSTTVNGDIPDFVLRASRESWAHQQALAPRPGYQALSTMRRCGHLVVEGDLLAFSQNLLMLEMLFTPAERQVQVQDLDKSLNCLHVQKGAATWACRAVGQFGSLLSFCRCSQGSRMYR